MMIMKKKPIRKKLLETKVLQEWSGVSIYTQTHYDHNNPPPKVIQGYKFNMPRKPKYFNHVNIFYQKSQTLQLFLSFLMIQSQDSTQLPTIACGTETEKKAY